MALYTYCYKGLAEGLGEALSRKRSTDLEEGGR